MQTLSILLPLVQLLAQPAVAGLLAGLLASSLLVAARRRFPVAGAPSATPARRVLLSLIWTPFQTRCTVIIVSFVLAVAIVVPMAALVALIGQADPLSAMDVAFAGVLAPLISQITHAVQSLPRAIPELD